eukprot:365042-Chlamydomonas_euryale.AAC.5
MRDDGRGMRDEQDGKGEGSVAAVNPEPTPSLARDTKWMVDRKGGGGSSLEGTRRWQQSPHLPVR